MGVTTAGRDWFCADCVWLNGTASPRLSKRGKRSCRATAALATPTPIKSLNAIGTQVRRLPFTGRGRGERLTSTRARPLGTAGSTAFLGFAGLALASFFGGAGTSALAGSRTGFAGAGAAFASAGFLRRPSRMLSMLPLAAGTSGGGSTGGGGAETFSVTASGAATSASSIFFSRPRERHPVRGGSGAKRSPRQAAIDCGRNSMLSRSALSIALRKPVR